MLVIEHCGARGVDPPVAHQVSLYTILQCTISYGVWRETGGRKRVEYCAIVLQ